MTQKLRALACFDHIESIVPISAGLSSQCFKVNADKKIFFAKQLTSPHEASVSLLAATHQLSPKVIYHDQHWLITEFIAGKGLAESQQTIDEKIITAIKLMTQCHQIKAQPAELSPKAIVTGLINESPFSSQQQKELLQMAEQLTSQLSHHSKMVCCHGDLNFSNILIDHQKNSWLIDFECASTAPAEFDLAMFVAVNNITKENISTVIELYKQHSFTTIDHQLVNAYLLFCYFINGLWYFNATQQLPINNKRELKALAQQQWQYFDELSKSHHKTIKLLNPWL